MLVAEEAAVEKTSLEATTAMAAEEAVGAKDVEKNESTSSLSRNSSAFPAKTAMFGRFFSM